MGYFFTVEKTKLREKNTNKQYWKTRRTSTEEYVGERKLREGEKTVKQHHRRQPTKTCQGNLREVSG